MLISKERMSKRSYSLVPRRCQKFPFCTKSLACKCVGTYILLMFNVTWFGVFCLFFVLLNAVSCLHCLRSLINFIHKFRHFIAKLNVDAAAPIAAQIQQMPRKTENATKELMYSHVPPFPGTQFH